MMEQEIDVQQGIIEPQDVNLEAALLGGILLEPLMVRQAKGILGFGDFYLEGHSALFRLMIRMDECGIEPNPLNVVSELRGQSSGAPFDKPLAETIGEHDLMTRVGGEGYIMSLINAVPTGANVPEHAKRLKQIAQLRDIGRACQQIRRVAFEGRASVEECLRDIRGLHSKIESGSISDVIIETAGDIIEDAIRMTIMRQEEGEIVTSGFSTGFENLDLLSGGFLPEELWTIAAQTNTGKSRIGLYMAAKVAQAQQVGFLNLEMGRSKFGDYAASTISSVAGSRVTPQELFWSGTGDWIEAGWRNARLSAEQTKLRLIQRAQGASIGQLRNFYRKLAEEGCKIIFIDQAQRIKEFRGGQASQNRGIMAEVVQVCKDLAAEFQTTTVLFHQINREGYDMPTLRALYDCSAFEHVSDHVLFFYDAQRALLDSATARAFVIDRLDGSIRKPNSSDAPHEIRTEVTNPRPITLLLRKTRGMRLGNVETQFHYGYGAQVLPTGETF